MNPRLVSSKKWTNFPKEYLSQIEQVFSDAFAAQLTNGKLILDGRIYPEEIMLRVGFLENGRLQQANFEVSMNYSQENQDAVDRIYSCIDAAASMMGEYFAQNGEVDFPRKWKEYDFNGNMIFVQYTTDNTNLEAEANRLLGIDKDSLVQEEQETEDALAKASERLHDHNEEDEDFFEDEDEDSDEEGSSPSQPTIFSGKKRKKGDQLH